MGIQMKIFVVILCFISVTYAEQGNAVYYDPPYNTKSACYPNQNHGAMVTGVRGELWDDGRACGRRYRVKCIAPANTAPHPCHDGQSVEVEVIDYCRPPCNGILNLSKDAFNVIADTTAGKVLVEFDQI